MRWNAGTEDAALALYVPSGETRVVRPSRPPAGADRLLLTGDAVDFDNTLYLAPRQAALIPLLYVGDDADEDREWRVLLPLASFSKNSGTQSGDAGGARALAGAGVSTRGSADAGAWRRSG